jgi:hypothetical protein
MRTSTLQHLRFKNGLAVSVRLELDCSLLVNFEKLAKPPADLTNLALRRKARSVQI